VTQARRIRGQVAAFRTESSRLRTVVACRRALRRRSVSVGRLEYGMDPEGRPRPTREAQKSRRLLADAWALGLFLLAFTTALGSMLPRSQYVDEETHVQQIESLQAGRPIVVTELAVIPGYHAIVAGIAAIAHVSSTPDYRFISAFLVLAGLPAFAFAAFRLAPSWWQATTLQCVFLPLVFPFFFLVYTDAPSVVLVVLMFWLLLVDRVNLAGLAALAAVLVRQSNVLWAGFGGVFYLVDRYGWWPARSDVSFVLRRLWALLGVAALFLGFVAMNGGIAIHDRDLHPLSLHSGNIFFTLFALAIVLLPLHLANLGRIRKLLGSGVLVWLVLALGLVVFLLTFTHDHPCNDPTATIKDIPAMSNLREIALVYFTSSLPLRLGFFAVAAWTLLSLWVTALLRPACYLLYPFAGVFLATNWLIEQRYAIIPAVLFILLRKRHSLALERAIVAVLVLESALITFAIAAGRFEV
jgi:alpha-1,2-glucosyltransferase